MYVSSSEKHKIRLEIQEIDKSLKRINKNLVSKRWPSWLQYMTNTSNNACLRPQVNSLNATPRNSKLRKLQSHSCDTN